MIKVKKIWLRIYILFVLSYPHNEDQSSPFPLFSSDYIYNLLDNFPCGMAETEKYFII